jgi:hypothetical protein
VEQPKGSGMSQPIFHGFVHCGRTRSLPELQTACVTDARKIQKMVVGHIYDFLAGLNSEYYQV